MKEDLFERVVGEVLSDLPQDLKRALDTVQILVKDAPSADELDRAGMDSDEVLYGLFDGVSRMERDTTTPQPFPDRVILYRQALEADFPNPTKLKREIRTTLIHELGHFFGMDEEDLKIRGYE